MKIGVRLARGDDDAFVEDLGRRTVRSSVASVRPATDAAISFALVELLRDVGRRQHVALIAECDGARAGFLLLVLDLPDEVTAGRQAFIAYMAVEPVYRRRGVGSALLRSAELEGKRRGLPYVCLMVTQDNASARALYDRSGFATERRLLCKPL